MPLLLLLLLLGLLFLLGLLLLVSFELLLLVLLLLLLFLLLRLLLLSPLGGLPLGIDLGLSSGRCERRHAESESCRKPESDNENCCRSRDFNALVHEHQNEENDFQSHEDNVYVHEASHAPDPLGPYACKHSGGRDSGEDLEDQDVIHVSVDHELRPDTHRSQNDDE